MYSHIDFSWASTPAVRATGLIMPELWIAFSSMGISSRISDRAPISDRSGNVGQNDQV